MFDGVVSRQAQLVKTETRKRKQKSASAQIWHINVELWKLYDMVINIMCQQPDKVNAGLKNMTLRPSGSEQTI